MFGRLQSGPPVTCLSVLGYLLADDSFFFFLSSFLLSQNTPGAQVASTCRAKVTMGGKKLRTIRTHLRARGFFNDYVYIVPACGGPDMSVRIRDASEYMDIVKERERPATSIDR